MYDSGRKSRRFDVVGRHAWPEPGAAGRDTGGATPKFRVGPVHHRSQLAALLLDLRVLLLLAHPLEVLLPRAVLCDPLARELAGLDLREHVLHRLARRLRDDPLAARVVAVLGGVRDRVAHAADPLLVHEVDDQLPLVEALEVGEARVVARLDKRLVARLNELAHAPA